MYDEMIKERLDRAEKYDGRTRSQQSWYSGKAGENKKTFQTIGLSIVVLGAIIGVVPLIFGGPASFSDKLVAALGAAIVILKGIERIWLPEEKWVNYRKASEALLREKEKYVECIYPYNGKKNEDEIYKLYVERCILIKAEEQNNFWGISGGTDNKDSDSKDSNNDVNGST